MVIPLPLPSFAPPVIPAFAGMTNCGTVPAMSVYPFPYEHLIATTPDWPVAGVLFRDISPLLAQKFPETIGALAGLFTPDEVDKIDAFAGVDARGFIFAAALAQKFGKNLVIVRKGGKLPPPSHQESYALEYGSATLELKPATKIDGRAPRIVILDDVLATGGTLSAAANLCAAAGYNVVGLTTLIDLKFLSGDYAWRGLKPRAVVTYE